MPILITGAAGFIGFHLSKKLLEMGHEIHGIDNLNDYYDLNLKKARLNQLEKYPSFCFYQLDIADHQGIRETFNNINFDYIINLAAQAGVRHSIEKPFSYLESNLAGFLSILELARHQKCLKHFLYASSSSVYGNSEQTPFSEEQKLDEPVSLYAATKKSNELMAHSYSHLYSIPSTGLRFFTVYGPWGRPDMAYFSFTQKILSGEPIRVFNHGNLRRDFTYIDDIIQGIISLLDTPPVAEEQKVPYRILNIGNNQTAPLDHFIATLEKAIGQEAVKIMEPMQAGDVYETYANIDALHNLTGYQPTTTIEQGLPKFIEWYRNYYQT